MSKRVKQYLMLLAALGVIAVALGGGSGTFASFNAVVSNNDNVFATGTLFLHDTTNGTTCTSESVNTNANLGTGGDSCSTIFDVSAADSTAGTTYYQVALKNAGTLNASDISFYSNSVCAPTTVGVDDGTVDGDQPSTSSVLVSGITLSIPDGTAVKFGSVDGVTQGVTASDATQINTTAPVSVTNADHVQFFPAFTGTAGNLCSALGVEIWNMDTDSTPTQDPNGDGGTCVYGCSPTHTLSDVTATENSLSTTLDAGDTKYIEVGIVTPDLDNSFQSQQAKLSLAWKIAQ